MREVPLWVQEKIDYVRDNNLTELDLSLGYGDERPRLNFIPSVMCELTQLKDLNLKGHDIHIIPSHLSELKQLTRLTLEGSYGVIPEGIGELKQLTRLALRGNYGVIPEGIGELKQLTQLMLWGNYSAVPEGIGELKQLTQLMLWGSYSAAPEGIGELPQLNQLTLGDRYNVIPEGIRDLKQLTYLTLRGSYSAIPEEIGELKQLTQLMLWGSYSAISGWIRELKQLTHLMLYGRYSTIPEEIGELKQLTHLTLWGRYSAIPEVIGELKQLIHLTLSGKLQDIPDLVFSLERLKQLDLADNHIKVISSKILDLPHLAYLNLGDNPIEVPPPEIVKAERSRSADLAAIRNYYLSLLEEKEDYLYEAKFLIIGEGGAGKTSLARKILDPDMPLPTPEDTTRGIDVLQWQFPIDGGRYFRVNIWDFGGQEIYHATHQFFLTSRSLYALVADTRKEDTDFNYWLSVVELLSDNSPLLIINNEKEGRIRQINERQLMAHFRNVKDIFATNLKDNQGLEEIREAIAYQIERLPHIGTPLPKSWVDIRNLLEHDDRTYLTYEEYLTLCRQHKLNDLAKMEQIIGYFHDLGVCLHFRQDPLLKRYVILKPEWGTTAVYAVLDNDAVIRNLGRFTKNDLKKIWASDRYSGMRDELLQLMMNFKLCYQVPYTDTYIAPQLLTENQPEYDWNEHDNLILRYDYDFMPKGILTRFIVEMHPYIKENLVWKTGIIISYDHAIAEIMEDYKRREIRVRVAGHDKKSLMAIVISRLDALHSTYHDLKFEKLIPCNCSICMHSEPYYFKYEFLKHAEYLGREAQCQMSFEMVNPRSLIDDILVENSFRDTGSPQLLKRK
jgi:internalin A